MKAAEIIESALAAAPANDFAFLLGKLRAMSSAEDQEAFRSTWTEIDTIDSLYAEFMDLFSGTNLAKTERLTDEQLLALDVLDSYVAHTVAVCVRLAMYNGIGELLKRSEASTCQST